MDCVLSPRRWSVEARRLSLLPALDSKKFAASEANADAKEEELPPVVCIEGGGGEAEGERKGEREPDE